MSQETDLQVRVFIGSILPDEKEEEEIKKLTALSRGKAIRTFSILENPGFAKGNNLILQQALKEFIPDYVLIVNPDIRIHDTKAFESILTCFNKYPAAALAGPKVLLNGSRQQGPYLRQNPWVYGFKYLLPIFWAPFWIIRSLFIARISRPRPVWRVIGAFVFGKFSVM